MSTRFFVLNGLRVILLVLFVTSSSTALQVTLLLAMVATLAVDAMAYREDKRREAAEEESDLHVPMPPEHVLRDR